MGKSFRKRIAGIPHPNQITASGIAFTVAGLGLLTHKDTSVAGLALLAAGVSTDALDGYVARIQNLQTEQGARLDPLVDKLRFGFGMGAAATYEALQGSYALGVAVAANLAVDYVSQRQRGGLVGQVVEAYHSVVSPEHCTLDVRQKSDVRANGFGKAKTGIQTAAMLGYWGCHVAQEHGLFDTTFSDSVATLLPAALFTSAVLGGVGIVKRMRQ